MNNNRPHVSAGDGGLMIGGISASSLAGDYGTPLYVTDLDRVLERYRIASEALTSRHEDSLIAFAYKSNCTPDVVGELSRSGAGATVVSPAGLELALRCKVSPEDIVYDGPSKSLEELEEAARAGVGMINAESIDEVLDLEHVCAEAGIDMCNVGFRINFGIGAETHAGLATGSREHKFGVSTGEVIKFVKGAGRRLNHVGLKGLHSHVGSQIMDPGVFRRQTLAMVNLGLELKKHGVDIREFNFGGGLGIDYGDKGKGLGIDEYAEITAGEFESRWRQDAARVVIELGRWIVADSTILLTRVNYLKNAGAVHWALVDAGMNDFLRPALYAAYHEIVPAQVSNKRRSERPYSIGGPVCETTDVFGSRRTLGVELSRGDLLAVLDTGAYGSSMASTYNMRSLPKVVVLSKGQHRLVG